MEPYDNIVRENTGRILKTYIIKRFIKVSSPITYILLHAQYPFHVSYIFTLSICL